MKTGTHTQVEYSSALTTVAVVSAALAGILFAVSIVIGL